MSLDPLDMQRANFQRVDLESIGLNPRARDVMENLPLNQDAIQIAINETRAELNEVEGASFVVWQATTDKLTDTRTIADSDNVTLTADSASVKADLTDTGVTPDTYGAATKTVSFTVDEKGRMTVAAEFDLNSDNVLEGLVHLFFTVARARASLSDGVGIDYNSTTGVIAIDLAAGSGIDISGNTISLDATGVTPGTYASPSSVTVGADGRITAIA